MALVGSSTDGALCRALARAIALGGAGLVLDLSEVDFRTVSDTWDHRSGPGAVPAAVSAVDGAVPNGLRAAPPMAAGLSDPMRPRPESSGHNDGERAQSSWVAVPRSCGPCTSRSARGYARPRPGRVDLVVPYGVTRIERVVLRRCLFGSS